MKKKIKKLTITIITIITIFLTAGLTNAYVIDHSSAAYFDQIPNEWIEQAKNNLHIAYQHTSHGSQLVTGMSGLRTFPNYDDTYLWTDNGASGLDFDDYGISGCADLSQGDSINEEGVTPWVTATRNLLDNPNNYHINVIMWSWCSINGHNIPRYLENMETLISEYGEGGTNARAAEHPVQFVFMTGHAEGQGEDGFIYGANQQIRQHCIENNRILFDFADIESYDPDGTYYYDKPMWDNIDYTDQTYRDNNWAENWIANNPSSTLSLLTTGNGIDGFDGTNGCAHSSSPQEANLNCVLKGRASWYLFARLAGWNPDGAINNGEYHIGPGQEFSSLREIDWLNLQPGDKVYIHYRDEPYREIIGLRVQGTKEHPISIIGVPDQNGNLPVISGENAVVDEQFSGIFYTWTDTSTHAISDYGVIIVASDHDTDPYEYKASHIVLKNLKIIRGRPPYTYTFHDGTTRSFVDGAAGIRVFNGDDLSIIDCEITENGNGIFLNGHGTERTITRNTLIEGNHIWDNGNIGRDREHNVYSQGINTTFQYNWIEPLQVGAIGSSIKDRSSSTIIRYNWIEASARAIDLVEPEDADVAINDPSYQLPVQVYGNVIINDATQNPFAGNMIHYGGDTGITSIYRQAPLQFYYNTVYIKADQTDAWRMKLFDLSTNDQEVFAHNNIIHSVPITQGASLPNFYLMNEQGVLHLQGTNWIKTGWSIGESGRWFGQSFQEGTIISGDNPEFTNAGTDFSLLSTSSAIDRANPDISLVNKEYVTHQLSKTRITIGTAPDLGAFESTHTSPPPTSFCGDALLDSGEACDTGENNGVVCQVHYNGSCSYCSNDCQEVILQGGFCGDEVCDVEEDISCIDCCTPSTEICGNGVDEDCDSEDLVCPLDFAVLNEGYGSLYDLFDLVLFGKSFVSVDGGAQPIIIDNPNSSLE